ncbi:MAG: signal peptidase II [Eubacteriales bacterium]
MGYILGIIGIFTGDYFLKNWIDKNKEEKKPELICNGKLKIQKYYNYGAFLNIGEKTSRIVAVISLVLSLILTILFIITLGKSGKSALKVGLTFLLGGAFSNTYDRLVRGRVIDYVSFPCRWKKFSQIVFNISDFCIIIGAMITAISAN